MKRALLLIAFSVGMPAIAGCGRGGTALQHTPRERHALLLLYEKGATCHARVPKKLNAYEGDTIVWEVVNECSTAKRVKIVFNAQTPVTWIGNDYIDVNAGIDTKELRATVNSNTQGRAYPYQPQVNGALGSDPDLEIDPYM